MNNYKIRVNNEAESREAQELFFELGYEWISSKKCITKDEEIYADEDGDLSSTGTSRYKFETISLPQLRDLVVKHRKQTGLISGADALRALADGEDVQGKLENQDKWIDVDLECDEVLVKSFLTEKNRLGVRCYFRLKPRTIKLEIEVPAPFEPKVGDVFYILSPTSVGGYCKTHITDQKRIDDYAKLGAWRTESEIKIVVEQLSKLKEHSK